MKNKSVVILTTVLLAFIFYICHISVPAALQEKPAHPYLESQTHKGKVITTMDSGGYTYIEFKEKGRRFWVACPKTPVHVDDMIEFSRGLPMNDFHSKTLNRTFASILFVSYIKVEGAAGPPGKPIALPKGHIPIGEKVSQEITVKPGSIKKAEGGYTAAECYSMRDSLEGKIVHVRGKVIKFIPKIMGKNWIHIQDGTGKEGMDDLTVTSTDNAKPGEVVLISGKIAYNKDFGAGYVYPVIIEDASIIIDQE